MAIALETALSGQRQNVLKEASSTSSQSADLFRQGNSQAIQANQQQMDELIEVLETFSELEGPKKKTKPPVINTNVSISVAQNENVLFAKEPVYQLPVEGPKNKPKKNVFDEINLRLIAIGYFKEQNPQSKTQEPQKKAPAIPVLEEALVKKQTEETPVFTPLEPPTYEVDEEIKIAMKNHFQGDKDELIGGKVNTLVKLAGEGDGRAFGTLYQIYVDRIYNYIYYKTGHSVDAEDLTAQVFIKTWEAVRRFRFEGKPFAAWVFKVARNTVIDHYRTRKNTSELSEAYGKVSHEGDPEEYAQQRATGQVLMTAIHRLTDEQQQVILLKFIDGMDNTEISATMGKREGAVRALQYRALLALQRILQDERYGLERKPREFETIKNGQTHYLRRTTNQESEEELIAV